MHEAQQTDTDTIMSHQLDITLEESGSRIYLVGNYLPIKDAILAEGAELDRKRLQYYLPKRCRRLVESIIDFANR